MVQMTVGVLLAADPNVRAGSAVRKHFFLPHGIFYIIIRPYSLSIGIYVQQDMAAGVADGHGGQGVWVIGYRIIMYRLNQW